MNSRTTIVPCNRLLAALALLVLASCARVTVKPSAELPALSSLVTADAVHYVINADDSNIRFLVYRAGPLAAFGHNHVIRAAVIQGDVYLNPRLPLSGFEFTLPVKDFHVDEPVERAAEGGDFDSQPSPQAIAGTTRNMLGAALLDAVRYPAVSVRSVRVEGTQTAATLTLRITLRGVQRDVVVPVKLAISDARLVVSGTFDIKQSDFGITPFSILGGGLQVADTVRVHFRIVSDRH